MKILVALTSVMIISLVFATNLILANNGRVLDVSAVPTPTPTPRIIPSSNAAAPPPTYRELLNTPQDPDNFRFPVNLTKIGVDELTCKRERFNYFEVRLVIFPME